VLDCHSGVAWPQPPSSAWDAYVSAVPWENVGISEEYGTPHSDYFCKQGGVFTTSKSCIKIN
jgi:hypothetical protein